MAKTLSLIRRLAAAGLLAGLTGLAASPMATAAPFEDTIAQRAIACTACHGPQGRAAPDGYYPRLAGKPAGYLYNQLLSFRDGRRHYGLMTQLLEPLSGPAGDAYLMEIAQYFSQLEVPYPAPLPTTASAESLRHGQRLVKEGDATRQLPACVQCHGLAMTGVSPNIPGLLGLPRDYLNAQLGAWKNGQRRAHAPDCMKDVVARLSLEDINAVANWLAAQPLPASTKPATALPALAPGAAPISCGSAPAAPSLKAAEPKARK
ncbi:c-type cytochrome [Polaromonas jejuensis]|uniref:C-type cytochrome n=1 Tax=Polaromonas jejuensis TaxID=457502 RepID=A0ABW0Q4A7_9BURK|nr:c-type cytochrome [Polaromonas jejuensis]